MKIFFSTLFDDSTYPLNIFMKDGVAIGAIHLGPTGLLHFFELHLGIPASTSTQMQRVFQYREKLEQSKSGSFYESSFDVNDIEVASTLLNWRDELS